MTYQEFLEYIYKRHSGNIKLGLERIESILRELGNPQQRLSGVHVAGTNGKGSTCAMLEALALQAGYSTGFNSSPHLLDYLERFRLSGCYADYNQIMDLYLRHQQVFERNQASFFETTTALAFQLFAEEKVDFSIFEVGLGGRLDGTNPFVPGVSVITSIGMDHTKTLGDTLAKIAGEKAGIIKEGVPVVVGKVPSEALAVIEQVASQKNAKVYRCGQEFSVDDICLDSDGTSFRYDFGKGLSGRYATNLLGKHQAYNAACALSAFSLYQQKLGKRLDFSTLERGLKAVNWQGRMQIVAQDPTILLDGAHNEQGVSSLVDSLSEIFPHQEKVFIVSILKDKNLPQMYAKIAGAAKSIVFCQNSNPRAAGGELQSQILSRLTASNDYMDDEKQSIMEWARKQPLDRLFQIFSQHFYTNESIGNLFSGEWTADEVQAMNNTVTDCWQIAYLDSLPLADGIKMLVQLMMENIMAGEEEKEEEEKFSDPQASEKLLKVVSQTRSKDILRIVKKHEKKEPYQLLLRFCYNFPAKENDESKVAKISADLIHFWENNYSKPPRDN